MPTPHNPYDKEKNYRMLSSTGPRKAKTKQRTVDSYSAASTHERRRRADMKFGIILIVLLCILLVAVSVIVIVSRASGVGDDPADTLGTSGSADTGKPTEPEPIPEGLQYFPVEVPTASMHEGPLILVNYEYEYTFPSSVQLLSVNRNKSHYITWYEYELEETTLMAFNTLIDAFYAETGCEKVLMNSAYRSYAEQIEIFETSSAGYATEPGHSEHHTGLALDIQIYDPKYRGGEKKAWYFAEYDKAKFLVDHFADYGFILRYPEDKIPLTKIEFESWHYRYIGTPHAAICDARHDCFEEYVEYLETLSFEGKRLHYDGETMTEDEFTELPEGGYMIYFVPAAEGETTEIPILMAARSYAISGDNVGGFVVTVRL